MKSKKGFVTSKKIPLAIIIGSVLINIAAISVYARNMKIRVSERGGPSTSASSPKIKDYGVKIDNKKLLLRLQKDAISNGRSYRYNTTFNSERLRFFVQRGYIDYMGSYAYDHINLPYVQDSSPSSSSIQFYKKNTKNYKKDGSYSLEFGPFTTSADGIKYYRIVTFFPKKNIIRWLDIFSNETDSKKRVRFQLNSYLNNSARPNTNLKNNELNGKKHFATWFDTERSSLPYGLHIGNGKKARFRPFNSCNSCNYSQVYPIFYVKPKSTVIIASFTGFMNNQKNIKLFVKKFKAADYFKDLDPSIKRAIINFNLGGGLASLELNRDRLFDKIILADKSPMLGRLKNKDFEILTKYGQIKVPAKNMIGFAKKKGCSEEYLILLADGQVISGRMKNFKLELHLDGIGIQSVPSSDIKEFSYKVSPKKPDFFKYKGGFIITKAGDRLSIDKDTLNLKIKLGAEIVKLNPNHIHKIIFDPRLDPTMIKSKGSQAGQSTPKKANTKTSNVPTIGFVAEGENSKPLSKTLDTKKKSAPKKTTAADNKKSNPIAKPNKITPRVHFQNSSILDVPILNKEITLESPTFGKITIQRHEIAMLQFSKEPLEPENMTEFVMKNGNKILGKIFDQEINLQAKYGKIKVKPQNIRSMSAIDNKGNYRISLWNGTVLTGKFEKPNVAINIIPGPKLNIDIASLQKIIRTTRSTANELRNQIIKLITLLGSESYTDREKAQKMLTAMGAKVIPILKKKLSVSDPEIRQRIKKIIEDLESEDATASSSTSLESIMIK